MNGSIIPENGGEAYGHMVPHILREDVAFDPVAVNALDIVPAARAVFEKDENYHVAQIAKSVGIAPQKAVVRDGTEAQLALLTFGFGKTLNHGYTPIQYLVLPKT